MDKESNLTTKDLSYVTDIFNWNINCYNAFYHFQNLLTEKKVQELVQNIADEHKKAYEDLLDLMK